MMRVTQEDRFDDQPLHDSDLMLVADLRLDNRQELAEAMAISPSSLSVMADSALLFAAYKKWGADCAERLVGDFAFAAWDFRKRTLTLARDHMGQRNLYYHQGDGFFAFASEIKGLWALPEIPRTLLEQRIAQALLFDERPVTGGTGYEGIRYIPGGTLLTVDASSEIALRRYWEPRAEPAHLGRDEAYYVETYRRVLAEAVACRLRRAIAPAGLLNGGGFDSSAICALSGPVVAAQGRQFVSVSSVMPEDYKGTIHDARRWVEMCRRVMPHLDVRYVTREGIDIFTGMELSFLRTDASHGTARYVYDALFRELAAAGCRVVMDGYGGDYTLNPRGQDALAQLLRQGHLRRFLSEFRAMRRHLRQTTKQTLVRNVILQMLPASWIDVWRRYRSGLRLFGPTMPVARSIVLSRDRKARPLFRRRRGEGLQQRMIRALWMAQNSSGSVQAATHGLELTRPFHDKRVVEFALAVPEALSLRNGRTRHLARAALGDLYPAEYQDRRPGNDDLMPDFLLMAKRVERRVLAEIDRMQQAGRLGQYFDFPRMRAMLTRRTAGQHDSGNEYDTRQAMSAFVVARHFEWFRGENS